MDTLKKIFSSVLGIQESAVTLESSPENMPEWDSLNSIILLTEIEKAFNIRFNFDEAMAVKNFKEIVQLVRSKGVNL